MKEPKSESSFLRGFFWMPSILFIWESHAKPTAEVERPGLDVYNPRLPLFIGKNACDTFSKHVS